MAYVWDIINRIVQCNAVKQAIPTTRTLESMPVINTTNIKIIYAIKAPQLSPAVLYKCLLLAKIPKYSEDVVYTVRIIQVISTAETNQRLISLNGTFLNLSNKNIPTTKDMIAITIAKTISLTCSEL